MTIHPIVFDINILRATLLALTRLCTAISENLPETNLNVTSASLGCNMSQKH